MMTHCIWFILIDFLLVVEGRSQSCDSSYS